MIFQLAAVSPALGVLREVVIDGGSVDRALLGPRALVHGVVGGIGSRYTPAATNKRLAQALHGLLARWTQRLWLIGKALIGIWTGTRQNRHTAIIGVQCAEGASGQYRRRTSASLHP